MRLKGRPKKIVYSVGNLGMTGFLQLMSVYVLFFLIDTVHMDPGLASVAFLISYGVWNAINDPIIGFLSDKTRTRWGRRKPFILAGIPLMSLFGIIIWSPPIRGRPLADPHSSSTFLFAMIVLALYELGFTMVSLCRNALFPEMWTDLEDRSEVTVYRESFSVLGGVLAMVIFPLMINAFTEQVGTFGGWAWAGGVMTIIFSGTFVISVVAIQERKEFLVDDALPFIESLKAALTNKSWITKTGATLMTSCMIDWISAISPFFVKYSLRMGMEALTIMMGVQMIAMFCCFPFWRKLCIKYGTKVTIATSMTSFTVGPLLGLVAQDLLGIAVMGFAGGITIGGLVLARALMWADIIDEDETKTGVRREGVYAGISAPIGKLSQVILAAGMAFVLSAIGYVSGLDPQAQPPSVDQGFRLGMAGFPVVFTSVMLVFIKFYPLGKERVEEIHKTIKRMHAEKVKKLDRLT